MNTSRQLVATFIETRLAFLKFAALHFISAKNARGWGHCGLHHPGLQVGDCKMSTPILTRLLLESRSVPDPPKKSGMYRPKLRYAHQGGMNPPVIVIHGNSLEHVTDSYKRYLEGRFRKEFDLVGTPLRIQMKSASNTYADKDNE